MLMPLSAGVIYSCLNYYCSTLGRYYSQLVSISVTRILFVFAFSHQNITIVFLFKPLDPVCHNLIYASMRLAGRTAVLSIGLAELISLYFIRIRTVFGEYTQNL